MNAAIPFMVVLQYFPPFAGSPFHGGAGLFSWCEIPEWVLCYAARAGYILPLLGVGDMA